MAASTTHPAGPPVVRSAPAVPAALFFDAEGRLASLTAGARALFGPALDPCGTGGAATAGCLGPPLDSTAGIRAVLDRILEDRAEPGVWTGDVPGAPGPAGRLVVSLTATPWWRGPGEPPGLAVVCAPAPDAPAPRPGGGAGQVHRLSGAPACLPARMPARVGHELRGPLIGIGGLAGILLRRREQDPATSPREIEQLRMIQASAHQAIGIVDRIIAITMIDSGQVHPRDEAVDAVRVVGAAADRVAPRAGDGRITVRTSSGSILVRTDPELLTELVAELLDNALTATAGAVDVTVRVDRGALVIEIADEGPGLADAEYEAVFAPFAKTEATPEGGAGLGLHLARERAHLIGADLTGRRRPGSGSVFRITVTPAGRHPAHREPPHPGAPA